MADDDDDDDDDGGGKWRYAAVREAEDEFWRSSFVRERSSNSERQNVPANAGGNSGRGTV